MPLKAPSPAHGCLRLVNPPSPTSWRPAEPTPDAPVKLLRLYPGGPCLSFPFTLRYTHSEVLPVEGPAQGITRVCPGAHSRHRSGRKTFPASHSCSSETETCLSFCITSGSSVCAALCVRGWSFLVAAWRSAAWINYCLFVRSSMQGGVWPMTSKVALNVRAQFLSDASPGEKMQERREGRCSTC